MARRRNKFSQRRGGSVRSLENAGSFFIGRERLEEATAI
jgi:hypothetical protein